MTGAMLLWMQMFFTVNKKPFLRVENQRKGLYDECLPRLRRDYLLFLPRATAPARETAASATARPIISSEPVSGLPLSLLPPR